MIIEQYPQLFDGALPICCVMGDLFVPVLNEVAYVNRVNANGKGDLLAQRAIRGAQRCQVVFLGQFT